MIARLSMILCLALGACNDAPDALHGYAEGRYRLLTTQEKGKIAALSVAEGTHVAAGSVIAQLDTAVQDAKVAHAAARLKAAQAQLADSQRGGRTQEIEAAQQRLVRAKAAAVSAQQDFDRIRPLFERGNAPRSRLDAAQARLREAKASVAEREEELQLARLPQRTDRIKALEAEVAAASASLKAEQRTLARMALTAPSDGLIERVLRRTGEMAGPEAPVVRFLPDNSRIAVLFVPQPQRPFVTVGEELNIDCDGCEPSLTAQIDLLASDAEFTSPMIFSDRERSRLVYRLEAQFVGDPPPVGTPIQAILP